MFARHASAARMAKIDHAYNGAEAEARKAAKWHADEIIAAFRQGFIDQSGVDRRAREKLIDIRAAAETVALPAVMREAALNAFRGTLFAQLAAAGVAITELRQ